MDKNKENFKQSLDVIKNEQFYSKLNESSKLLRQLAGETADFLISVKTTTPEFNRLIRSLQKTQSIPIEQINDGLEEIQAIYHEINREMTMRNELPMDAADFFMLAEKQNRFNAAANGLFEQAVQLCEMNQ